MVSNKNQSNYCNTTAGKLDWGDYPVITLKRYLYGMALTSKLETVHLIHLDNDVCKIVRVPQPFFILHLLQMFKALFSMLDRISRLEPIGKEEIERENMCGPDTRLRPKL